MRALRKFANGLSCAILLVLSGCWMGGNARSAAPTPVLGPPAPTINSPQYGPVAPISPAAPNDPALNGPVINGPTFPQSSKDGINPSEGFNRKRHSQKRSEVRSDSEYAGTTPPPFVPDGPIAKEKPKSPERTVGFTELPPAP